MDCSPPSTGFSRQDYWSGLPFPSPTDFPDQGIESGCPAFQADSLLSEPPGKPLEEKMKFTQSCLAPCNPMDYTAPGILQARILEWIAFPFLRGSSQPRDQTQVSCIASGFFTSWSRREVLSHSIIDSLCSVSQLKTVQELNDDRDEPFEKLGL